MAKLKGFLNDEVYSHGIISSTGLILVIRMSHVHVTMLVFHGMVQFSETIKTWNTGVNDNGPSGSALPSTLFFQQNHMYIRWMTVGASELKTLVRFPRKRRKARDKGELQK